MVKPRSRRHAGLQTPEEVLTLAQRLLEPAKRYWKWLLAGALGLVLPLGAWEINAHLQAGKEERAGAAWVQVRPKLSGREADPEAIKALEGLIRECPGTNAAREAQLFRAHLLYQMKNYAEAAKAYESLRPGRDPGFDNLLAESLSYCYEALGDFRKAATVLQPVAEKTSGPFQGEVLQRLAWLLDQAGDSQEASRYWKKLLAAPPFPGMVPYLQEKAAAAEEKAAAAQGSPKK